MKLQLDIDGVLQNISKVKLSGGVVGKVSLAVILVSVSIATIACWAGNTYISAFAVLGIVIFAFTMLWRLISFADRNPKAALLEGAEFLLHEQLTLGSKDRPVMQIDASDRAAEKSDESIQVTFEEVQKPDVEIDPGQNPSGEGR